MWNMCLFQVTRAVGACFSRAEQYFSTVGTSDNVSCNACPAERTGAGLVRDFVSAFWTFDDCHGDEISKVGGRMMSE